MFITPKHRQEYIDNIDATEAILEARTKYEEIETTECERCCVPMEMTATHYICNNCGFQGEQLPYEDNFSFDFSAGYMPMSHKDSNYSAMLNSINKKLCAMNTENILQNHIFRDVAHRYVEICKAVRDTNNTCVKKPRCSSVLPALLFDELGSSVETYRDTKFICRFMGIDEKKLIKSRIKLLALNKENLCEMKLIPEHEEMTLTLSNNFLELGVPTKFVAAVIDIANVCADPQRTIDYRSCGDSTVRASVIWLIAMLVGIIILPETLTRVMNVSKSTYERFMDMLFMNRKIINPILVRHKIRPIPRTFAMKGLRRKKVLSQIVDGQPFHWKPKQ